MFRNEDRPNGILRATAGPLCVLLLLLCAALCAQENSGTPGAGGTEAKYKEAFEKFSRSDIAGALDDLNRMAADDPMMIPPRLILAQWFTQAKNPSAVRLSLEKAVEETPDDPEAYILLAENALRQGEWAAADLLLGQAEILLEEEDTVPNPQRRHGLTVSLRKNEVVLCQARENYSAMQRYLADLWKLGEKTPETCKMIGVSYFHLGDTAKARQWFAQGYKISPETELTADEMMARLYLAAGDRPRAQEALDAALAADPDSHAALNLSLVLALGSGDAARVKGHADRLRAADPHDPAAVKTCGIAALYLADYARAEALFREGLRRQPDNGEMQNGLVLALSEQNDPEKIRQAVQIATVNQQRQSDNREYLATLGWALFKAGETDRALEVLQHTAADGKVNSQTAYYLGEVLNAKGRTDDAKRMLGAALSGTAPFAKRAAAEELLKKIK